MADVKKENALVQGSEQRVIITASGFVAPLVTTKIGNKVIWTNRDRKAVTIIADNGEFSGTINAGASFSHTFETKGMYLYRTTNGDVEGVIMVATR